MWLGPIWLQNQQRNIFRLVTTKQEASVFVVSRSNAARLAAGTFGLGAEIRERHFVDPTRRAIWGTNDVLPSVHDAIEEFLGQHPVPLETPPIVKCPRKVTSRTKKEVAAEQKWRCGYCGSE